MGEKLIGTRDVEGLYEPRMWMGCKYFRWERDYRNLGRETDDRYFVMGKG
jgi:hypothetical protein